MIEFNCPSCEKTLRTKPEKAGAKAKCPGCGEVLTVPGAGTPEPPVRQRRKPPEDEFGGSGDDEFGGFGDEDYTSSPTQDEFWGAGDEFGGQTRLPRRQKKSSRGSGSPRSGRQQECPMCGEMTSTQSRRCEHCGEPLKSSSSGARRRGYDFDYAGFWLRFVAAFVDGILMGIVGAVVGFVIGFLFGIAGGAQRPGDGSFEMMQLVIQLIGIIINWLYYALMESSEAQATLGKQMLGIIVTDVNGERISFGRASGRHFGKIISGMLCLAGYIMAGFTEQKQALHDIMASTLVVRKD